MEITHHSMILKTFLIPLVIFGAQMASLSEGAMASVFHSRFFRRFVVFLCAGAALFVASFAVSMLVGAATGHGSRGGNVLSIGLGLILLYSRA